jgi:hypothetical protein
MPGASSPIAKWMTRMMSRQHRRAGYRFQGMNVLFLTTTGRKSGQRHENPVAWFPDGDDAWLIVASAAGRPATRPGTSTWPRTRTRCGSSCRAASSG